ncbi:unnamed protein product, partial [Mesorhabditis belari]|uniref:Alpha-carbonic anhydrase domain-containing protein n=1 Tax=Mesorhabditis belari TaxID=2138241 RepID=A0AAF3EYZ6_9BILA
MEGVTHLLHELPELIVEFYFHNFLPKAKLFTGRMTIAKKHRQSPIDIRTEKVCCDPKVCQVNSLHIDYKMGDCVDVECSESGWKVNVAKNCQSFLTGSHLEGKYELAQFHAHWSYDGTRGSEHMIDGKPQAAEVHFVFWNTKYSNINEALEKPDGLAVVGVFIHEGLYNENYQPLLDAIKRSNESDTPAALPHEFTIEQLMPDHGERDFVTYLGSLTTPPYNESVIWTLFTKPIEVSKDQLNVCRKICGCNYRPCQELCERQIISSTVLHD